MKKLQHKIKKYVIQVDYFDKYYEYNILVDRKRFITYAKNDRKAITNILYREAKYYCYYDKQNNYLKWLRISKIEILS